MLPLIAAQPGIWLADQLSRFDNAYTVVHFLELRGSLDAEALLRAIARGLSETDAVQMAYEVRDGVPCQVKGSGLPEPVVLDYTAEPAPRDAANAYMQRDMQKGTRLNSGAPLVHHALLQLGPASWIWYQRYHHIQLDAYSFTALTRRMAELYSRDVRAQVPGAVLRAPQTAPFAPLGEAAAEYVEYAASPRFAKDAAFWREYCRTLPPAASLKPVAGAEASKHIVRGRIQLDRQLFAAACAQLPPADVALGLATAWLLRLCNVDEMSIGFIFMRRLGSRALQTAGAFINVLPLAIHTASSLEEMAQQVQTSLKKLRRHQKYDSERIVRESGRSWAADPLYGPVINYKAFDYDLDFEGVECTTHHVASGPIRDLEVVLHPEDGGLSVEFLANGDRYDVDVLKTHLERFNVLLRDFAAPIVLPKELEMLAKVNSTEREEEVVTLRELIARQARLTPCRIAVEDSRTRLNYAAMHERVSLLALKLRECGVRQGRIVAVCMDRSVGLSIAIQAAVMAGAAYLPVDPAYPEERRRYMLRDARPLVVLRDPKEAEEGGEAKKTKEEGEREGEGESYITICVSEEGFAVTEPDSSELGDLDEFDMDGDLGDLDSIYAGTADAEAYVIYTSGSTGRPKGVAISHRAIVNRLRWMQHAFPLDDDAVLQKTPSSFDVSVWEFFWPLITGARCVLAPPGAHRDPAELRRVINRHKITTIHFVPSMLAVFVSDEPTPSLRRVFCSGEALPAALARRWARSGVPLWNLYGPTEAAVDVSYASAASGAESGAGAGDGQVDTASEDTASDDAEATDDTEATENSVSTAAGAGRAPAVVPIGRPIWNTQLHVLDSSHRLLPPGIPGELYIGGTQLGRYLRRPALTAERFPTVGGARLYQTGDVAQWDATGVLHFLGRRDGQVKLRGQRIELGEIDAAAEKVDGVRQAATVAQGDVGEVDARQLVTYCVGSDAATIRAYLAKVLPNYMVPHVVVLPEFPLNASGKLDRAALPKVVGETSRGRMPSSGVESGLAAIYGELLGVADVRADDDFFSLGGHSLLAVRLVTLITERLHKTANIGQIMQAPRIDELARLLENGSITTVDGCEAGCERVLRFRKTTGPTLFCLHPASGFAWQFSVLRRHLSAHWSLVGLQSASLDGPLGSARGLADVVNAHFNAVVAEDPVGPYFLLGYSLGGTLAHALAAKLVEEGREVAFLGLLDTWPPESQSWASRQAEAQARQARARDEQDAEDASALDAVGGAVDDAPGAGAVDPAVLVEMQRERELFETSDAFSTTMFDAIAANYRSAVRLLATARSAHFAGEAVLFVAERTLPPNTDLAAVWRPWTRSLHSISVDAAHVDIIHPKTFETVGPKLNEMLNAKLSRP